MDQTTVLIVEDNRSLSLAVAAVAERIGFRVLAAPSLARAREELDQNKVHCLLLDIGLPDGHSLTLLKDWHWGTRPPVAVISAHGEIENAIAARQLGVSLFLDKPLDFDQLQDFLRGVQSSASHKPRRVLTFVGAAPAMRPVIRQIAFACADHQPVVIRGESGTGKSHIASLIAAQTIEDSKSREVIHATPQLKPADLIAHLNAAHGVLTIERVHLLSIESQQSLARQMDQPGLHSPRFIVTVDDEGLRAKVSRGNFDSDLYYRLQVLEIHIPPLSERRQDIPALIDSLLGQLEPSGLRSFDEEQLLGG